MDGDAQKSSSLWLEGMEVKIPYLVLQTPDDLLEQLPDLVQQIDFNLIKYSKNYKYHVSGTI